MQVKSRIHYAQVTRAFLPRVSLLSKCLSSRSSYAQALPGSLGSRLSRYLNAPVIGSGNLLIRGHTKTLNPPRYLISLSNNVSPARSARSLARSCETRARLTGTQQMDIPTLNWHNGTVSTRGTSARRISTALEEAGFQIERTATRAIVRSIIRQ